jgi:tetratricopeptide (TPR) repeat protein
LGRRGAYALAVLLVLAAACRTAAPPPPRQVPDPLPPPAGSAPLDQLQLRNVHAALAAAERGNSASAQRYLASLPTGHPVTQLVALEMRLVAGEPVNAEALALARAFPAYTAAWEFALDATRRESRWENALEAVQHLEELQPSPRWSREAEATKTQAVRHLTGDAEALLAAGKPAAAVERARALLELVPSAEEARLVMVRGYLAMGEPRSAAGLVPALPDTPEGLRLKGAVAEALGQWELAQQLYMRLPKGAPDRCELLAEAAQHARLATAPPYVSLAMTSPQLTRGQLAAILVWEVPAVSQRARGPVAVFEDVVQVPEARDIVAVVRAGLMRGDAVTRRFRPRRPVSASELTDVLGRLAALLGGPQPVWCGGDGGAACLQRPSGTLSGEETARLVRRAAGEGEDGCPQT